MHIRHYLTSITAIIAALATTSSADAACCYFSAKNTDILQPAQKVFITWDPEKKIETFTVQPKFEGNALDFGMVIPTPTEPKLDEMPKDFFKNLAVYSILMQREFPKSKLLPKTKKGKQGAGGAKAGGKGGGGGGGGGDPPIPDLPKPPPVIILQEGVVGSLDYKVIAASRADDLYKWLKDHKYQYSGDEATLNFYVQQKWVFTVMKIDTLQMKKAKDGTYSGDVTPTRFQFSSDKLIYPLKITQISVKDKTEALFYVQAPYKVDLQEDMSFQRSWVPLLVSSDSKYPKNSKSLADLPAMKIAELDVVLPVDSARIWLNGAPKTGYGPRRTIGTPPLEPGREFAYTIKAEWDTFDWKQVTLEAKVNVAAGTRAVVNFLEDPVTVDIRPIRPRKTLPGLGSEWLVVINGEIPWLLAQNKELGYEFVRGKRPTPNAKGRTPTTLEWARKLTQQDIAVLLGKVPFSETVPDVDEGFTQDKYSAEVIGERLRTALKDHPNGYLVRYVPEDDIKALQGLVGHLQAGLWITKFRKIFCRDEMNADLLIVPARLGDQDDFSEYIEILPASPP